jgi:hypothetical protein
MCYVYCQQAFGAKRKNADAQEHHFDQERPPIPEFGTVWQSSAREAQLYRGRHNGFGEAVLRSLKTGDASHILGRKSLDVTLAGAALCNLRVRREGRMTATTKNFGFTENGALQANIAAFFAHLGQKDCVLAAELQSQFKALLHGTYSQPALLTSLLAAAEKPSQPQSTTVPSSRLGGQTTPPASSPAPVTGWLLEGLAIEGFRGINNQGKPLELKFHPDKVNSISAVNGVGKSSVYDAVRYAICGAVPWLEELPASERGAD